ncbi:hypothetical protein IW492_05310 [Enterococcus sp. BWB1-3]|nr:hypothetical protein [Enterococcus sp. BWB1-3]MBL1228651.1 hypothetical protein [Enterococcus sp. BWB1-3]
MEVRKSTFEDIFAFSSVQEDGLNDIRVEGEYLELNDVDNDSKLSILC